MLPPVDWLVINPYCPGVIGANRTRALYDYVSLVQNLTGCVKIRPEKWFEG